MKLGRPFIKLALLDSFSFVRSFPFCSFAPAHTHNNNTRNFFFNGFLPPSYFYSPTTCIVREFHRYTILIAIISAPQTFLFCVLSSFIDYQSLSLYLPPPLPLYFLHKNSVGILLNIFYLCIRPRVGCLPCAKTLHKRLKTTKSFAAFHFFSLENSLLFSTDSNINVLDIMLQSSINSLGVMSFGVVLYITNDLKPVICLHATRRLRFGCRNTRYSSLTTSTGFSHVRR